MLQSLDPQLASFFAMLEAQGAHAFDIGTLNDPNINEMRNWYLNFGPHVAGQFIELQDVEDLWVQVDDGNLRLRLYKTQRQHSESCETLIYFHGGGWCIGSIETHDLLCRHLVNDLDVNVISVDYRLAPEYPYPQAAHDAIHATQWIFEHASALGIHPDHLYVAGDSAGGNLAAITALTFKEQTYRTSLAGQILIYPCIDLTVIHDNKYPSFEEQKLTPPLSAEQMSKMIQIYLKNEDFAYQWLASPLLAQSHQHLPSTLIITAEFDPLRDQGRVYFEKLKSSLVNTEYHEIKGVVHGFFEMYGVLNKTKETINVIRAWLKNNTQAK